MALPITRVLEINQRAIVTLQEYSEELKESLRQNNLARIKEIKVRVDLLTKIVKMANKPYIEKMNLSDDIRRALGLLDDEDS